MESIHLGEIRRSVENSSRKFQKSKWKKYRQFSINIAMIMPMFLAINWRIFERVLTSFPSGWVVTTTKKKMKNSPPHRLGFRKKERKKRETRTFAIFPLSSHVKISHIFLLFPSTFFWSNSPLGGKWSLEDVYLFCIFSPPRVKKKEGNAPSAIKKKKGKEEECFINSRCR